MFPVLEPGYEGEIIEASINEVSFVIFHSCSINSVHLQTNFKKST